MIETTRLIIRRFREEDSDDLYDYLSTSEIYLYEPGRPISKEEARILCAERAKGLDFLAVELKEIRKMIGHIYFKQVEPAVFMTWEIGYIFHPDFQRKGYGTESVKAVADHGFREYSIHRIMARCNPDNIASWKLLEKAGFRREGFFRKYAFFHRDERGMPIWTDAFEYSFIRE